MERSDWSEISGTVERKYIKLGLKMTAMSTIGEAKPIKFRLSLIVLELLTKECFQRAILTTFGRSFAVIG